MSGTNVKARLNGKALSSKSLVALDERTTRRDERATTIMDTPVKKPTQSPAHPEKAKNFFKSIFKKKAAVTLQDANMPLTGKE